MDACTSETGDTHAAPQASLQLRLRSAYVELTEVDEALRQAQERLACAHQNCAHLHSANRAEELYREILMLRDRSRRVLRALGEMWVAGS